MNEQLQNALAEILGKTINGIDASVEFMQSELPDVISQLLLWYAVEGLIYGLFGLLLIYVSYLPLRKSSKGESNWACSWSDDGYELTPESMFGIFLAFPAGVGLFLSSKLVTSLKIAIAPEIWLIEYAASLTK